ncbi:hypothetical protein D3C76_1688340 [compost metagenome]
MHATPARQLHRRLVAVVGRVEDDHFVAAVDNRLNGAEDRLGGTGGDGHLGVGIDPGTVAAGNLRGHLLAQRRQAGHG